MWTAGKQEESTRDEVVKFVERGVVVPPGRLPVHEGKVQSSTRRRRHPSRANNASALGRLALSSRNCWQFVLTQRQEDYGARNPASGRYAEKVVGEKQVL